MPDFSKDGWQGFWLPGRKCTGEHGLMYVLKRRFEIDLSSGEATPAETKPVSLAQVPYEDGEAPRVSPESPSEIALEKPRVDILVKGKAYAPNGKPAPFFDVEFRIPQVIERRLRIYGQRRLIWYPPVEWLTAKDLAKGKEYIWPDPDFTEPEPLTSLPLRYEYAYGGWAKMVNPPGSDAAQKEAAAVQEVIEDRREKKKEILEKLKEEEDAKAGGGKAAEGAGDKPSNESGDAPPVEGAKAEGAVASDSTNPFSSSEVAKLDEQKRQELLAAEAQKEPELKVASAFGLDAIESAPKAVKEAAKEAGEGEKDGDGNAADSPDLSPEEDPNAAFFTQAEKTSFLDTSDLQLEDEYAKELASRAKAKARELTDKEGALRDEAQEFGDIQITDDSSWAAKYLQKKGTKKKKQEEPSDIPEIPFAGNMAGLGFIVSRMEEAVDGVLLPQIEDPSRPLTSENIYVELGEMDLKKLPLTAGWGPFPPSWYPRAQYFGVFPWDLEAAEKAIEDLKADYDEEDPDDQLILKQLSDVKVPLMHPLAYQEAHPSMQVKEIRGNEECYFTNLSPNGSLFFNLPGVHPAFKVDTPSGPMEPRLRIDQILFDLEDPEAPAVELCWRSWVKLKDFDELEHKFPQRFYIDEMDQEAFFDIQRRELVKQKDEGLTKAIMAIDEEALEAEGDALEAYKAQFKKSGEGADSLHDREKDALLFDQEQERQVIYDEWSQQYRDDKEAFIDEQVKLAEAKKALRDKALKAKARELADEEFGIIRDPETGEILAVDPPKD